MKLITKHTDYAIRALRFMIKSELKSVSAAELSEALDIPRPFLRGLMQQMATHGIIASKKGRGGGFRLSRSPIQIKVIDIITLFQGKINLGECEVRSQACPDIGICFLRQKVRSLEKHIIDELTPLTLAELVKKEHCG